MQIQAELIEAILTALTAFFAGGGLSYTFWKKKAGQAAGNLTVSEVLGIALDINKALAQASPGGPEITSAEAEALGRAVWAALQE